jgi:hypothetical protein
LKKAAQRALCCPCGRLGIIAHGLCPTCYSLKRQDQEYFGGLREQVLERDEYRCRVCEAPGRDTRSIVVHHRVPGKSVFKLNDLALSWVPREGPSDQSGAFANATSPAGAMAAAAS